MATNLWSPLLLTGVAKHGNFDFKKIEEKRKRH